MRGLGEHDAALAGVGAQPAGGVEHRGRLEAGRLGEEHGAELPVRDELAHLVMAWL